MAYQSQLSDLQKIGLDDMQKNGNPIDKMFETFKGLKESQDKLQKTKNEHLENVASINNKNMIDPNASFLIDPQSMKAVPIPKDLEEIRQAGFQKGAEIEARKAATTLNMLRESGVMSGGMIPSIGTNGKVALRGQDPNAAARAAAFAERNKIAEQNRLDRLEKNYITNMNSVISSNQKPGGLQNTKVNQALDLRTLIDNSKDPKTGEYKIPPAQHTEIALGLAKLLSPTGVVQSELVKKLEQGTLKQKLADVAIYFGRDPKQIGGTTQSITKFLISSIDRQGLLAEDIRDKALKGASDQFQTSLPKEARDRLMKTKLTSSFREYLDKQNKGGNYSDAEEKAYQAWKASQK
jgi:hypothetical protein